jgi:dynein light intermediate chain 1
LRKEMELPEGTLETNLFIATAIVCTKVDLIEHGDKEIKSILEKNLDFIQYTLRKYCLSYGTTLLFTSSNSNQNIQLLYNYILYRLYDEEFPHTSNINDKEALFVPTGFDSMELINQSDLRSFQLKN